VKDTNFNDDVIRIAVVGHIDHGKSTLIGRLLYETDSIPQQKIEEIREASAESGSDINFAFVMDHLFEERVMKITMDTSQVFFKSDRRRYVIIDTPGHREFIKNMITGSSVADCAILVVDADEGICEQTKIHSFIISLMGIRQIVVVVNKMDIVKYNEKAFIDISEQVCKLFETYNLRPEEILPLSALHGENVVNNNSMSWFKGDCLLAALDKIDHISSEKDKKLRLPVQGSFKVGDQNVYMGRIEAGTLKKSNKYLKMPEGTEISIEQILKYEKDAINSDIKAGEKGESTGFTTDKPLGRGDIIIESDGEVITDSIQTRIFWMVSEENCRTGDNLIFESATRRVPCMVEKINYSFNSENMKKFYDPEKISLADIASVELKFNQSIMVDTFSRYSATGRFVLVKNDLNVAGGIVC